MKSRTFPWLISLIGLFYCELIWAQKSYFNSGDRVCFVGNSITNNGEYHHNILLYQVTRFPNLPIQFFNCGISGDVISGVFKRLEDDILVHRPTHVVLMLGMNDVNRRLYGPQISVNSDTLSWRTQAIDRYKVGLDSLVRVFLQKNIQVILQKPTIFDETGKLSAPNQLGVNAALKQCADYIETLSQKYNLPCVDYWTFLNEINRSVQTLDPSKTIIGQDRVHPSAPGHLAMAYQFITTMQDPQGVSIWHSHKKSKAKINFTPRAEIELGQDSENRMEFSVKESYLPFPTTQSQDMVIPYLAQLGDWNKRVLAVKGLKKGNYRVQIDSMDLGIVSNQVLAKGIVVSDSLYPKAMETSLMIKELLMQRREVESKLRTLKFVEYGFLNGFNNPQDMELVKKHLERILEERKDLSSYFKEQFARYIQFKSQEKILQIQRDAKLDQAYQAARPPVVHVKIEKVSSR